MLKLPFQLSSELVCIGVKLISYNCKLIMEYLNTVLDLDIEFGDERSGRVDMGLQNSFLLFFSRLKP